MSTGGGTTIAETKTPASILIFINSVNATQYFNEYKEIPNTNVGGTGIKAYRSNLSNFEFVLDEPVIVPNHHSILLSMMSAEIPYSFYNFNDRNNTIQWVYTAFNVAPTYVLVPDPDNPGGPNIWGAGSFTGAANNFKLENNGNYTAQQLADSIDTPGYGQNPILDLNIEFDEITQKFKIRYDGTTNPTGRITLLLGSGNLVGTSDMTEELGYTKNFIFDYGDPYFEFDGATYESGYTKLDPAGNPVDTQMTLQAINDFFTFGPHVADLNNQVRNLFLRTNLSSRSVMDSYVGGGFSNILGRVPINAQPGGVITILPQDGNVHKLLVRKKAFTSLTLRLTNHRNETIDLNGLNFDVALKLDFIENSKLDEPENIRKLVDVKEKEVDEKTKKKNNNGKKN